MSSCTGLIDCAISYAPRAFEFAFALVAAASALAAATPTPSDDKLVGRIYKAIDFLALNFGYAKDKPKSQGGRFIPD